MARFLWKIKYKKEHAQKRVHYRRRAKQWKHEKCWVEAKARLHVFKHGSETEDLCYCGRKKLKEEVAFRSQYFIEAR